MNKSDLKLVVMVIVVILVLLIVMFFSRGTSEKNALVYYEDKLVLTIDLTMPGEHEYTVNGYNGAMLIKTNDGKIKVEEENSPLHICSKQGWIENSYEVLVCLPNKVVVKIQDKEEIDTVVK